MTRLHFERLDQEQTWMADSGEPGPTAVIVGGIHGSEISGIRVVDEILDGTRPLSVDRGRVVLIRGNPRAIELGARQTPGGKNLNRQIRELTEEELKIDFKDLPYEVQRGQLLKPVLALGHRALDLHGFSRSDGTPFIITERDGFSLATEIGAPIISSGWSEMEPGSTDEYMQSIGRLGICYEVGWNGAPEKGRVRGRAATLRFLAATGLLERTGKPLKPLDVENGPPRFVQGQEAVIAGPKGLTMSRLYRSFEPLQEGEVVARSGDGTPVLAGKNQVIIFPPGEGHLQLEAGDEAFNFGTEFDPNNDPFVAKSR